MSLWVNLLIFSFAVQIDFWLSFCLSVSIITDPRPLTYEEGCGQFAWQPWHASAGQREGESPAPGEESYAK